MSIRNDGLVMAAQHLWSRTVGAPPLPIDEFNRISGLSVERIRLIVENFPELFCCHDVTSNLWIALDDGPESALTGFSPKGTLDRIAQILDHQLSDLWYSVNFTGRLRRRIAGFESARSLATVEDLVCGIFDYEVEIARDILVHLELLMIRGTYINLNSLIGSAVTGNWRDSSSPIALDRLSKAKKERLERTLDMISMRSNGASLQEIGDHFGVSRERVRQILSDLGVVAAQRYLEVRDCPAATRKQIMAILADTPGIRREELELATGLPWQRIYEVMPARWNKFLGKVVRETHLRWSETQIIEAIQMASQYENPLSQSTFDALVKQGIIDCCSTVRVAQIFGLWSVACGLAGVTPRSGLRSEYHRIWNDDDCVEWVCRFLLSPAVSSSHETYTDWAREQEGEAPSPGTIRGIVGKWSLVINLALSQLRLAEYSEDYRRSLEADLEMGAPDFAKEMGSDRY